MNEKQIELKMRDFYQKINQKTNKLLKPSYYRARVDVSYVHGKEILSIYQLVYTNMILTVRRQNPLTQLLLNFCTLLELNSCSRSVQCIALFPGQYLLLLRCCLSRDLSRS